MQPNGGCVTAPLNGSEAMVAGELPNLTSTEFNSLLARDNNRRSVES